MNEVLINEKDEITMKLLHFFITEKGYSPIVVHGAKDEIWLENMNESYSIVRIMSGHIHNREQLDYDMFKVQSLIVNIKKKTLRLKVKALSIFLDLEDNIEFYDNKEIDCIKISDNIDLKKSNELVLAFPDISSKLKQEKGDINLFVKITEEINEKTKKEAEKIDKIFSVKKPFITTFLIVLNAFVFLLTTLYGLDVLAFYGALAAENVRNGELYRLITSAFLHSGLLHIFLNMYALYIIGPQLESFFGSMKFLLIYLFSAVMGALLSVSFLGDNISLGASGAIFGLFGALLYFGYYYRVYLGNTLTSQVGPIILINFLISFMIPGIDIYAHLGGLVGGITMSMALGIEYKSSKMERINGLIISLLSLIFFIYLAFIYTA